MGEFTWGRVAAGVNSLGRQYIATPSLLRVPTSTACFYYFVWACCLTVKCLFGYYALVEPLVAPLKLLDAADYRCWTPWPAGSATPNPTCAPRAAIDCS